MVHLFYLTIFHGCLCSDCRWFDFSVVVLLRVWWCINQYSKILKDIKSLWFWFFDSFDCSLASKISFQFHSHVKSPGTSTTAPASLWGTCHHWKWRWHWKNLRPVCYFHRMTCMIACGSSKTRRAWGKGHDWNRLHYLVTCGITRLGVRRWPR